MLANCGRILLRRAAFEVPKKDRLALLQRVAIAHNGYLNLACTAQTSSINNYNASARRSYANAATPAKPKAHTGKAKARTRKPAAKSSTAAPKKPASTAKKPAAKKTKKAIPSTKKAPPKKPKAATKVKAKPKKKAAPKPRVRKPKSDRQKALEVKRKERDALTELKETALIGKFPKKLPENPFHILVEQMTKEAGNVVATSKEASAKAKNLTPEELEHYNHIGNQNKATNEAAYKKVVEEHTPEQIRVANNARRLLKRRYKVRHGVMPIHDERQVKGASNSYSLFFRARLDSGDFKHMKVPDVGRLVGAEWRGLTLEEKDKYIRQGNLEKSRYRFEVKTVYGRDSKSTAAPKAAT